MAELVKTCSKCLEEKPLDAFYANANGTHGRMPYCKKCDNSRSRKPSGVKINRIRARHRALADLSDMRREDFQAPLAIRLAEAKDEAEELAASPAAKEHFGNEPVKLKPGKRMPGEKAGDRIDVARCPHCVRFHDRGHVCSSCGTRPQTTRIIPPDSRSIPPTTPPSMPSGVRPRTSVDPAALEEYNRGVARAAVAARRSRAW